MVGGTEWGAAASVEAAQRLLKALTAERVHWTYRDGRRERAKETAVEQTVREQAREAPEAAPMARADSEA